jgi:hypothetical protein
MFGTRMIFQSPKKRLPAQSRVTNVIKENHSKITMIWIQIPEYPAPPIETTPKRHKKRCCKSNPLADTQSSLPKKAALFAQAIAADSLPQDIDEDDESKTLLTKFAIASFDGTNELFKESTVPMPNSINESSLESSKPSKSTKTKSSKKHSKSLITRSSKDSVEFTKFYVCDDVSSYAEIYNSVVSTLVEKYIGYNQGNPGEAQRFVVMFLEVILHLNWILPIEYGNMDKARNMKLFISKNYIRFRERQLGANRLNVECIIIQVIAPPTIGIQSIFSHEDRTLVGCFIDAVLHCKVL